MLFNIKYSEKSESSNAIIKLAVFAGIFIVAGAHIHLNFSFLESKDFILCSIFPMINVVNNIRNHDNDRL